MKRFISPFLIVLAVIVLLVLPPPIPRGIGDGDFRAYWSASYLLTRGQNFSDAQKILQVERAHTDLDQRYPMMTWNPPWLLVIISPYTLTNYSRAIWWWLLTNITLVFTSAIVLWRLTAPKAQDRANAWIGLFIAFAYSFTLTTLAVGQVNLLVLAGLAGFLFFDSRDRRASAGAFLAMTLVKPQLVYVTVPILLLDAAHRRHWRVWIGFVGFLFVTSTIVLWLRPGFLMEYIDSLSAGNLLAYETPTLGGLLGALLGWNWTKWMGSLVLPAAITVWVKSYQRWDARSIINATVLLSVMTAPFAWSYDFVVLLIPLFQIVVWLSTSGFSQLERFTCLAILILVDGVTYYLRLISPGELYFFWVPPFLALLYIYGSRRGTASTFHATPTRAQL